MQVKPPEAPDVQLDEGFAGLAKSVCAGRK